MCVFVPQFSVATPFLDVARAYGLNCTDVEYVHKLKYVISDVVYGSWERHMHDVAALTVDNHQAR